MTTHMHLAGQTHPDYTMLIPFNLAVTNKSVTPPSGNKHDYMSWAP
jgi:hypothetical protein